MAQTALIKTILYKALAEGVYKDLVTRSSSYYYFLGKTLPWNDDTEPPTPVDSYNYEREVRNEIITLKEIRPSDIAFVVKRREWVYDAIYDMYDDRYCDEVLGIDLISGGTEYIDADEVTIEITGGGGTGATAEVVKTINGMISEVRLTNPGSGYTSEPTVTVISSSGTGALLRAKMGIAASGSQKLEDSNFYVVTDEYNVYKCLDNNNGGRSKSKPTGTQVDPIKTLNDGYVWKFMYNIPINLRNKFYTDEYIPVVSALTNHFYSNGTVDNVYITNKGSGYSSATVSVSGDGYRELDPIYINNIRIGEKDHGTGYTSPTLSFSPPFGVASAFAAENNVNLGQIIYNNDSQDYYEVVTSGTLSADAPTHRYGTYSNGTAALKFVGTRLKGLIITKNDKNITRIDLPSGGGGTGYKTPPLVTITDPTGAGATATAVIGTSSISSITVVNGGSGYSGSPTYTINGDGTGAELEITVSGGVITSVDVVNPGSGYGADTTVTINDFYGFGAEVNVILSGSPVLSVTVDTPGANYTDPTVSFSGGGGAGATATATVETGIIDKIVLLGSIRDIIITNAGSGYITAPDVSFSGGGGTGVLATSFVLDGEVSAVDVSASGQGYTEPPTITFVGDGYGATAEAVMYGDTVQSINVTNGGSGYTYPPEVVVTSVNGGNYAVARTKMFNDKVVSCYVVNPGENYTSVPTITFGNLWEPLKVVYTYEQYARGTNLYTVVIPGIMGSKIPTHVTGVEVSSPMWIPSTMVYINDTVYVEDRLYRVAASGTTHATIEPNHTSGIEANGTAALEYIGTPAYLERVGTPATGYAILRYGAGYSANPTVTVTDPTGTGLVASFDTAKSEAKISAITESNQLSYIIIDDPGVGYTRATLSVTGEGRGAALEADLSLGQISSQQANNEILTPSGTIDAISVISGGYSYGVANISIEGDGTGAVAEAEIDQATNSIKKVNIVNRGSGYTYANIRVIGNGQGAQLRAIISPYGGHGKNSPEELYARALMFYTNISTDLNQGAVVNNDYRQIGIIKNPRIFGGTEKFQGPIGSACYNIQTNFDETTITAFSRDTDLYIERIKTPTQMWMPNLNMTIGDFFWYEDRIYTVVVSGIGGSLPPTTKTGSEENGFAKVTYVGSTKSQKRYRIISTTLTSALVQSLDGDTPKKNDVMIKTSNISDNFAVVDVKDPSVDKYSGQMIYIDNKQGFTPSADETITLRTIIKF